MFLLPALVLVSATLDPFSPSQAQIAAMDVEASALTSKLAGNQLNLTIDPKWAGESVYWFEQQRPGGTSQWMRVNAETAKVSPAFDQSSLIEKLESTSKKLSISQVEVSSDEKSFSFTASGQKYIAKLEKDKITELIKTPSPGFQPRQKKDPTNFHLRDGKIEVQRGGNWSEFGTETGFASLEAVPGTDAALAYQLHPGDRRKVFLLRSSAPGTTRSELRERLYDQPGDVLDTYDIFVLDTKRSGPVKVTTQPITGGGQPWSQPPDMTFLPGTSLAVFDYSIRGYQEHRVDLIDAKNATLKNVHTEKSNTFINQNSLIWTALTKNQEIIWGSESSGWMQLYRIPFGSDKPEVLTKGEYVVRGIEFVDEAKNQLYFKANGLKSSNPYFMDYGLLDMKRKSVKWLTKADGTHSLKWSPMHTHFVDTVSTVQQSPTHFVGSVKNSDQAKEFAKATVPNLGELGLELPKPFHSAGRDGKTQIYGNIIYPANFDATKKYPVIENIYAGPHDSHVPHGFPRFGEMFRLAKMGFFVVQIDGMGTSNRGKKFHDVCYKNIADAGFPDRLLWMKSAAEQIPQMDISRVGIYGTSAGGQNAAGAVLWHPEFYKAAVASCGCHDNRIDKQWWNEQWMGYPVTDVYDKQSNITNASRLKGSLLLMVGELDTNVPPESTFRFADALIKAKKDFDFAIFPGSDHTDGGPWGELKRRDFFVRKLHGVNSPDRNSQ